VVEYLTLTFGKAKVTDYCNALCAIDATPAQLLFASNLDYSQTRVNLLKFLVESGVYFHEFCVFCQLAKVLTKQIFF